MIWPCAALNSVVSPGQILYKILCVALNLPLLGINGK